VLDPGYDLTRLAWLLDGLPVDVTGRLRPDRVMYFPAPPREPGANGRPPRHGAALRLAEPATWPEPAAATVTETSRYGTAAATAWPRLHQQIARRAAWEHHDGELPVIEGTLIRLKVDCLPGCRDAEPLWLWSSRADATDEGATKSPYAPIQNDKHNHITAIPTELMRLSCKRFRLQRELFNALRCELVGKSSKVVNVGLAGSRSVGGEDMSTDHRSDISDSNFNTCRAKID
jgi:hypothetical protein